MADRIESFASRALDLVAASAALFLATPIVLIAVLAIRTTSPGLGIFRQVRVGLNEKPFTLFKLRTMREGTRNAGTHELTRASITPVGAFLRGTKIDELPQLWNVVRGDMSLVGPRPCLPSQTEVIAARRMLGVFRLRPGITGPAQIAGVDMSRPAELAQYDSTLLNNGSVQSYLLIIALTLIGRGRGDRIKD